MTQLQKSYIFSTILKSSSTQEGSNPGQSNKHSAEFSSPHVEPSPLQTPHSSSTDMPPHTPAQSSTAFPSQSPAQS